MLVLVPSAIVIYAADFSALLGSVALWVALRRRYYLHILTNVRRLTLKGQKRAARALLTRIDDRDTDRLSTHGLAKTTLELQALSIVHHRLVPIVGWLIGGPILALGLRLIIEMAQLWPLAQARYLRFGLAPRALYVMTVGLITYVATAIAWLIASALRRRATISPSPSLTWDRPTITWLDNLSRLHNVSLGGPILVNGRRFARQRFAGRAAEKVWQTIAAAIERWQWGLTIVLMIALFWLFIYRP